MTRNRIFTSVFIVIVVLLFISSVFFDSVYTAMITTAVAIFGGIAIYYQIYKESKIAEGEFLHNLDESFKHEEIWCIAKRLFDVKDELDERGRFVLKHPLQEDERIQMMAYLTFFETLYLLMEQKVVTMDEIDQLFRRRFFKAVMNEDIQRYELVRNYYGYVNIYLLDYKWREHLRKKSKSTDGLETIKKHGRLLSNAHNDFWKGQKDGISYAGVLEMGGRKLNRRKIEELEREDELYDIPSNNIII